MSDEGKVRPLTGADGRRFEAASAACLHVAVSAGIEPERLPTLFANLLVVSLVSIIREEAVEEGLKAIIRDLRSMLPLHAAQVAGLEATKQ